MTHTAGFPQALMTAWGEHVGRLMCFASWTLDWTPGTRFEYHPWSAYWVIAHLIEQLSGEDFRGFVQRRVTAPLGLNDLAFGAAPDAQRDIADMVVIPRTDAPDEGSFFTAHNHPDARVAGSPGSGGIGTAAGLALFYQALLLNPRRLWDPDLLADVTQRIRNPLPDLHGDAANRSLGLCIAGTGPSQLRRWFGDHLTPRTFGKGGAAGAIAWADPDSGLSFVWLSNGVDSDSWRAPPRAHLLSARAAQLVRA
jgi:CubicO group peptidase (beta-lactamase class C family)